PFWPKRNWGISICGSGIETRSLPFLPIISPREMYLDRLLLTLPRTSFRNRWWSRSIFCPTANPPNEKPRNTRKTRKGKEEEEEEAGEAQGLQPPGLASFSVSSVCSVVSLLLLGVAAREDAGHEGQHVGRTGLIV